MLRAKKPRFFNYLAAALLPLVVGSGHLAAQQLPGHVSKFSSVARNWSFKGPVDVRAIALQPDQKVLMGGRFSIPVEFTVVEGIAEIANGGTSIEDVPMQGVYRVYLQNLTRLKPDGTLDLGAVSNQRFDPETGWLKVVVEDFSFFDTDHGFGIDQMLIDCRSAAIAAGKSVTELEFGFGPGMTSTGIGVNNDASVDTIRVEMGPAGGGGDDPAELRILVGGDFRVYGAATTTGAADPGCAVRTRLMALDRAGTLTAMAPAVDGPNAAVRSIVFNPKPVVQPAGLAVVGTGTTTMLPAAAPAADTVRAADMFCVAGAFSQWSDGWLGNGNTNVGYGAMLYVEEDGDPTSYGHDDNVDTFPPTFTPNADTLNSRQRLLWVAGANKPINSILEPSSGPFGVITDDNMLYFGGEFTQYRGAAQNLIARVRRFDGSLDATFISPFVAADMPPNGNVQVYAMAIGRSPQTTTPAQDYADVVVVGNFTSVGGLANPRGRIARLGPTGTPEANWPASNTSPTTLGTGANGPIRTIVDLPDGRYLIAGGFSTYNGFPAKGLARLEPDGRLDFTFDTSGLTLSSGELRAVASHYSGDQQASNVFSRYFIGGSFNNVTSAGDMGAGGRGIATIQAGRLPVILTQPAAFSQGLIGSSIGLSLVATDTYLTFAPNTANPTKYPVLTPSDPLYFQWKFKNKAIAGANATSLTINPLKITDAGAYTCVVSNYVYSSNAGVKVTSNPALVAVVNPFPRPTNFEGVVRPTTLITNAGVTLELGGTVSIKMNAYGSFTGTLTLGASRRPVSYKFSGTFNSTGDATVTVPRPNELPLTLSLNAPVAPPIPLNWGAITATLSDGANSTPVDIMNIPWSPTNPASAFAGYYTVGLQSSVPADLAVANLSGEPAAPQGLGYATVTIREANGAVTIKGKLADGTAFSRQTYIWGSGGIPVQTFLYNSGGSVRGLMTVAAPNITTSLTWSRPQMAGSKVYPLGFGTGPQFIAQGAIDIASAANSGLYTPPVPAAVTMTFDDLNCTPAFGGLPVAPIVQPFTIVGTKATPTPLVADFSKVGLAFNTKTGLFTGSAGLSADGRPLKYAGVIVTNGAVRWHGHFSLPTNFPASPTLYGSVQGN